MPPENPVTKGLKAIAGNIGRIASLKQQNPNFDVTADIRTYLTDAANTNTEHPEAGAAYISVILSKLIKEQNLLALSPEQIEKTLQQEAARVFSILDTEYDNQHIQDKTIAQITEDSNQQAMLKSWKLLEYSQYPALPIVPQQARDFDEMLKGLQSKGIEASAQKAEAYDKELLALKMRIWKQPNLPKEIETGIEKIDLTYISNFKSPEPWRAAAYIQETIDGFNDGLSVVDKALNQSSLPQELTADLTKLRELSLKAKTTLLDQFETEGEKQLASDSTSNVSWARARSTASR
jgi:hypothetical protein